MNKCSGVGLITLIFGLTLIVLKAISKVMGKSFDFADITFNILLIGNSPSASDPMTSGFFQSILSPVMNAPLYLFCLITGFLLLIIGGIYFK